MGVIMTQTRLVQISDLHISAGPAPYGRDTRASLARAFKAIEAVKPDAILATGDLTQDGTPEDYAVLRAALHGAPAPIFLMPGNHDNSRHLKAAFPDHPYIPHTDDLSYCIEHLGVRVIMLDVTQPNEVAGYVTPARAAWLDEALAQRSETPTMLALHHPPCRTYDPLFDAIGLKNEALLVDVLARHRQVLRIICGHYHRATVSVFADLPVVIAPSTGWHYRFALHTDDHHTPPTQEPIGFALHILEPDCPLTSTLLWT
jgi:3',5'-cyclic-AMP phosphodiesterase